MGRPYTMKEMKQIVDYLIEHRAYGEVRGRKLWVDFANSKIIDRTWQSMKETFIKRILPDIHNPYYKLNVEQISSFRQMTDVTGKIKNKLTFRDASDDSSASDNHQSKEQTIEKEDEKSGEDKCSKIQTPTRSSTETLVLDLCSDGASDNQKDIEPNDGQRTSKSLRDLIIYSEPLTPMLQEVIDDFCSDEEHPLQIVEDPEPPPTTAAQNEENDKSTSPDIRESNSYTKKTDAINTVNADETNKTQSSKIKSLKLKKTQKGTWENKEPGTSSPVKQKEPNNNETELIPNSDKNSTADTQLPNNQEALAFQSQPAMASTESSTSEFVDTRKKKKDKRKRSRSLSSIERKKKRKYKQRLSVELQDRSKDTQTFNSHPRGANVSKNLTKEFETINNGAVDQTNMSDDTHIPPNVTAEKTNEGTSQEAGPSGLNNPVNPCLKPASLFAEQFSPSKYSGSENEDTSQNDSAQDKDDKAGKSNVNEDKSNESHEKNDDSHKKHETSDEKNKDNSRTSESNDSHGKIQSTTSGNQKSEDVVLLKSHSDSDSEDFEPPKRSTAQIGKARERALANVFGFSCGSEVKRNNFKFGRTISHRNRNHRRSRNISNTLGSESESGSSEGHSPASDSRDEHYNHRRGSGFNAISHNYKKPKSFDIVENPIEGGYYVVGRNKVYPIVLKQGENVHYAIQRAADCNRGGAPRESFWKEKYLEEQKKLAEEKIRADELARLLRQVTERQQQAEAEAAPSSPILQPRVSLSASVAAQRHARATTPAAAAERHCKPAEFVKVKITPNSNIELEGPGLQISSVIEKIAGIFNNPERHVEHDKYVIELVKKAMETNKQETTNNNQNHTNTDCVQPSTSKVAANKDTNVKQKLNIKGRAIQRRHSTIISKISSEEEMVFSDRSNEPQVISSGKSTPVSQADPNIREKVDKIEKEIFKTIEEIDKSDLHVNQNGDVSDNITKRKRGRPKKVTSSLSSSSAESLAKKVRNSVAKPEEGNTDKPAERDFVQESMEEKEVEKGAEKVMEKSKQDRVSVDSNSSSRRTIRAPRRYGSDSGFLPIREPRSRSRSTMSHHSNSQEEHETEPKPRSRSTAARRNNTQDQDDNVDVGVETKRNPRSRSIVSRDNNTQDSDDDDSVRYMLPPKGRKPATRHYTQQLTIPSFDPSRISETTQDYQDSNTSPINITIRKKRKMGTAEMLNKKQISYVKRKCSPYLADDDSTNEAAIQKSARNSTLNSEVYKSESYQLLLPKHKAGQVAQMDQIDESPARNVKGNTNKNLKNFIPLTVEVNNEFYVPLNEPQNELLLRNNEGNSSNVSLPLSPELSVVENLTVSKDLISSSPEHPYINEIQANDSTRPTDCNKYLISQVDVSMPLMQQDCELHTNQPETLEERMSVNNVEPTDESLEKKLQDLLLESAKKIAEGNNQQLFRENIEIENATANSKAKRRSSTPRKRTLRSAKPPNFDPVLEEHTEKSSHSGRKSCPPVINIILCEDDNVDNNNKTKSKESKARKKKDVIKVKIGRPRRKSTTDKASKKRVSAGTDSGINDTRSMISESKLYCDESTELIHNHSDSCIHDDCVGDSVEFIENNNTIISLSSSLPTENNSRSKRASEDEFVTPESLDDNAQDATKFISVRNPTSTQSTDDDTPTVYHTPPTHYRSLDSLMTEDLSVDRPPSQNSNWHFFSEDDSNTVDERFQHQNSAISVGSNLRHIFPLTCAVPNLSTITELSKESETKNTVMDTFSKTISEFEF